MTPSERLETSAKIIQEYNASATVKFDDLTPEELAKMTSETEIKPEQMPKLIGIVIYIRKRLIEKQSRFTSFKAAFPERCVANADRMDQSKYGNFATALSPGDPLTKSSIEVKAKRLEADSLYLKVYHLMQHNLYISYAVDRMRVLDEALHIALDDRTPLRDKDRYMKLFLEETRKPENAKQLEFNHNLQSNTVNIASVEDKMNSIAQALQHATAAEVIDAVYTTGNDDGDN